MKLFWRNTCFTIVTVFFNLSKQDEKYTYFEEKRLKRKRKMLETCDGVTTSEVLQGRFWCRFVARFLTHLSPIWLETNVAVAFSLEYKINVR